MKPEGDRTEQKWHIDTDAMQLANHTMKILDNKKLFPEDTPNKARLISWMVNTAESIYIDVWSANNVLVKTPKDRAIRLGLQEKAARECNNLLAMINQAKSVFHMRTTKKEYWFKMVVNLRNDIRDWHNNEIVRYKNI